MYIATLCSKSFWMLVRSLATLNSLINEQSRMYGSSKKQACFEIGDHPFKTRHFWGEGSKINKIYRRERSRGQNLWRFADVLNGWSLGTFHSQSQREKKTPQHKNEVYRISHANPILSSRAPFSSSIQPRIASIFFLCPLFPKLKPPPTSPQSMSIPFSIIAKM